MKQRFAALFGQDCPHPPEIRTINGVSSKIIAYYAQNCGKRPPFILAEDESALAKLVSDLYRDLCGEYPTQSVVKELRKSIAYAKNMMLPEERLGELDTGFEKFPELYREYGKALRDNKWMDYDDQMVYAKKILELHEDVRTHFQNRFPYICVDESQDTSRIQHAIIRLLAGKSGNIFMVGDEDQSIYGFRAAYPDALMQFEQTYPGARVLLMEENYRSTPEILRAADAFIRKNHHRRPKTIPPHPGLRRCRPGDLRHGPGRPVPLAGEYGGQRPGGDGGALPQQRQRPAADRPAGPGRDTLSLPPDGRRLFHPPDCGGHPGHHRPGP